MRLITVESLKPGDVLSTPIRSSDGSLLLQANRQVTASYISHLKSLNISAIYVVDDLFDDVLAEPALDDAQKAQVLRVLGETFSNLKKKKRINYDSVTNASGIIFDNVTPRQMPISMINMFAVDDEKCIHSLNVAMIVAAMSVDCGWNKTTAVEYINGALLHDMMLDNMSQPEHPDHTQKVFQYLKDLQTIPPRTYMSSYMHHYVYSGGAGQRLEEKAINEGARMIAVADFYDNITHGYCGHRKMKPHEALEFLNTKSGTLLDPDYVSIFNTTVSIYPTGATVLLNNGYRAIVTKQNPKTPSRPMVRLLMKNRADCLEFNLLTSRTLFIEKVEI